MARKRQRNSRSSAPKKPKLEAEVTVILSSEDEQNRVPVDEECMIVGDDIPEECMIIEDKCIPPDPEIQDALKFHQDKKEKRTPKNEQKQAPKKEKKRTPKVKKEQKRVDSDSDSDSDWDPEKPSTSKPCQPNQTRLKSRRSSSAATMKKVNAIFDDSSDEDEEPPIPKAAKPASIKPVKMRVPIESSDDCSDIENLTLNENDKVSPSEPAKIPETPVRKPESPNLPETETFPETMLEANSDSDADDIKSEAAKRLDTPRPEIETEPSDSESEDDINPKTLPSDVSNKNNSFSPEKMPVLREKNSRNSPKEDDKKEVKIKIKNEKKIKEEKKIKDENRIKQEGEKRRVKEEKENARIREEKKRAKEARARALVDSSDEEDADSAEVIETPLIDTPPEARVQMSNPDREGEDKEDSPAAVPAESHVPQEMPVPSRKRNFMPAYRPSSSEEDESTSTDEEVEKVVKEKVKDEKEEADYLNKLISGAKGSRKTAKLETAPTSVKQEKKSPVKSEKPNLDLQSSDEESFFNNSSSIPNQEEQNNDQLSQEPTESTNSDLGTIKDLRKSLREKSPGKSQSPPKSPGNASLNVSLNDSVMEQIFNEASKKKTRGKNRSGASSPGSAKSGPSVSRQSSNDSIANEDAESSSSRPKTRARRGRKKKDVAPQVSKDRKSIMAQLKKLTAAKKKKATPKRKGRGKAAAKKQQPVGKDQISVFMPMFEEWINIDVTKETSAKAIMQFVEMSNPDFKGKELRMYFFSTDATDYFEEKQVDRIWPEHQMSYIDFQITSNNRQVKILVFDKKNSAQTNVIKEVPVVEKLTKPTKKPRVVESFHIVFQKGEGRDDVFKAYGDENMTIAELFEKTKWPKEGVNFEFDGEDCTSDDVVKELDMESGDIIEISYPQVQEEDEPEAEEEDEEEDEEEAADAAEEEGKPARANSTCSAS